MDDRSNFYCTVSPAPPGFQPVRLSKRHLLDGTVIVLVNEPEEIEALLPDYRERMRGIVLLLRAGRQAGAEAIGPLLWLLTLPPEHLQLLDEWLPGWLSAIRQACGHEEEKRTALQDNQRLRFELLRLREDYNRVTGKLQKQVDELTHAKVLLESWNEQLESKVRERTAELEQAQEQLVRSKKLASLGSLMAGFAHELNTPLGNALLSATTMGDDSQRIAKALADKRLRRDDLEAYLQLCRESTDMMQRNLRRAADLILHFKQVEGNERAHEPLQRFRLIEVVEDTVKSFGPALRGKPYRIEVDLPAALAVQSYPAALGQVLSNLMSNSLRHGFEGREEGRIRIRAQAAPDEGGTLLRFEDDGAGIPSGKLDQIFDPFYTTKLGQGGSGIGLYLVYKLVYRVLGGTLDVKSRPGEGTCFTITLPQQPAEDRGKG
jgi:signal transduction histidine kinase